MNAVDTNILVHAVDHSEPVKRPLALELLDQLTSRDTLLPWQVVCEFAAVMVRLDQRHLLRLAVSDVVQAVQKRFPVVLPDPGLVQTALRLR